MTMRERERVEIAWSIAVVVEGAVTMLEVGVATEKVEGIVEKVEVAVVIVEKVSRLVDLNDLAGRVGCSCPVL
jgi:hypothetical protein